jgi:hypothetical protein
VSARLACSPGALWYVRTAPVDVSVTVSVNSTFVSEPTKTQSRPLKGRPSTIFTARSTLFGVKNQK